MTKEQFDRCLNVARSDRDLTNVDDSVLHGCGLPNFQRVSITIEAAAKFLRWHVIMLNGEVDSNELNNMRNIFRHRVELVG